MRLILLPLSLLTILQLGWAQDIVLKSSFGGTIALEGYVTLRNVLPLDVNGDGINEQPVNCTHLIDVTNLHLYSPPGFPSCFSPTSLSMYVTAVRGAGLAEWVLLGGNPDWQFYRVFDVQTNDLLLQIPCDQSSSRILVFDYDLDGIEDLVVARANGTMEVYGIATGNPPIAPPQELDIQTAGNDYVIAWDSVENATAYRVEWSSSIDGVRFTRIGYTTGSTFIHKNQADQAMGFYRVMSEDNGTGVVRTIAQTSRGSR